MGNSKADRELRSRVWPWLKKGKKGETGFKSFLHLFPNCRTSVCAFNLSEL